MKNHVYRCVWMKKDSLGRIQKSGSFLASTRYAAIQNCPITKEQGEIHVYKEKVWLPPIYEALETFFNGKQKKDAKV